MLVNGPKLWPLCCLLVPFQLHHLAYYVWVAFVSPPDPPSILLPTDHAPGGKSMCPISVATMLSAFLWGQASRDDQQEMRGRREGAFRLSIPSHQLPPTLSVCDFHTKVPAPVGQLLDTAHMLSGFQKLPPAFKPSDLGVIIAAPPTVTSTTVLH